MNQKIMKEKLLDAASRKLFPNAMFEEEFKKGNFLDEAFIKREYSIRKAQENDMDVLNRLEQACWPEGTRTDDGKIRQRLADSACLNLVVEYEEKVVGVLYTQRIFAKNMKKVNSLYLERYRTCSGDCIQAIALNILPEYQNLGLGFELLEFALEYYSLDDTVKTVCAITRCRDCVKSGFVSQLEYMKNIFHDGIFDDATLKFHQLHGAKVIGLIPNYRPQDLDNQGYGVLVKYQIKERPWVKSILCKGKVRKENNGNLLLDYVKSKVMKSQINQEVTLDKLGFDSMDYTEMLIFLNGEIGLDISMQDLEHKTVKELWQLCEGDKKVKPLKKRIREIMREYPELVPLSLEGDGPLTFWIHPLSGDVGVYHTLATQLDGSFQMLAIKAKGFLSEKQQPLCSITEMAEYYCNIIEAVRPKGPYYLAGFSFGGTIAYEIARQLEKRGKETAKLLLVEAPYVKEEDRYLFQSSERNNIISNANFMLSSLLEERSDQNNLEPNKRNGVITDQMLEHVEDKNLIKEAVKLCKEKGLVQTTEVLEFKLRSISEVHKANLLAIQSYTQKKMKKPDSVKVCMIRTKGASAVSDIERNPEYLEKIQMEKGSLLPLLKEWSYVFPNLKTILLEGNNHLDIFHSQESVKKMFSYCKEFFLESEKKKENKPKAIAIVGMSGRFPDAECPEELWNNLKNGHCSIKKAPVSRGYRIEDYYDEGIQTPGKTYAQKGGFLSNVDKFDPLFFKMSHRDAEFMDPSERIFLEEAWKAIEDAGYCPSSIDGKKWGVFACAKGDYPILIQRKSDTSYLPTDSYAATRISYLLNLTGPAMTVDTACSSTAAVIALACNSIEMGESEVAVVGGGGIYSTPNIFIESSQTLLLSKDETCYAFDERANGTVIAETVGALVLKPLETAVADKDHIYGVIKGWGLNQDGKTNGMTAPNGVAQTKLQTEVYKTFGIDPEDITMIETHGTGTKLGDAIEFQALKETYINFTRKENFCALGSIKTNMGHAFFGAGIAGIIKILLCMKYKKIVPILNYETPSEDIDIEHSPFYFTTKIKDWMVEKGKKRMAALNSFGVTGTNVHLVIEEYVPDRAETAINSKNGIEVIVLSAKNKERLWEYARRLYHSLFDGKEKNICLKDMAYTLQVGRDNMEQRLAFPAETIEQVKETLSDYLNGLEPPSEFYTGYVKKKWQEEMKEVEVNKPQNMEDAREICRLWTEGKSINWSSIHSGNNVNRISLPTYPFEEESCWIDLSQKKIQISQENIIKSNDEQPKELMLLEEKWVEQPVEITIQPENVTVLCFLWSKNNQELLLTELRKIYKEVTCIFVLPELESGEEKKNQYVVKPADKESFQYLFEKLKRRDYRFDSILYLWPYEHRKYRKDYQNIQILIQAILHTKLYAKALWLCSPFANELERCYVESWRGFACSLGPMVSKTGINIILEETNTGLSMQGVERILRESMMGKRNQNVIWKQDKRYIKALIECKQQKREAVIKAKGTYLITGGLGGLGLLFAKYLAEKYQASLILTGRSLLTQEGQEELGEIRKLGGKAIYLRADVTDKQQMEFQLEEAQSLLGQVRGIIHAAGNFGETVFREKGWEEFKNTVSPKVEGVQTLEKLFHNKPLDFTCYFSSLSAILGDFGHCDYAVGNAFMMSYAGYQNSLESEKKKVGRVVAINWPLWRNGGMKMGSEEDFLYLSRSGQRYLENEEGIQSFETILTLSGSQYLVVARDSQKKDQMFLSDVVLKKTKDIQAGVDESKIEEEIEKDLKKIISNQYGIPIGKLKRTEHLMEYGFDSINLYEFARKISEHYKVNIMPSQLLGSTTIASIQEFLIQEYKEEVIRFYHKEPEYIKVNPYKKECITEKNKETAYEENSISEPVAIIGISGRFPRNDSLEDFWECLREQKECITKLPDNRNGFGDMKSNHEIYGGFLNEVDRFDPKFFGISRNEAAVMDPCQRIFLEEAWNTFEDAGYGRELLQGSDCGVYVGVEEGDYDLLLLRSGQTYGNQNAILSARIANILDLKGPNMSITASCSSGLTALHQACQAIRWGECEMALAGGIAILTTARAHIEMEEMEILSPTNRVSVYDNQADGMIPAEAVVTVFLKSLSKAIRDRDHIYGCILGSGVNYCGKGTGMMTPNPIREAELMKTVFERYHLNPSDIQFIIGHGMGVKMGDAAEVEALKRALGKSKKKSCYLSSVKPIVGHTFAASGLVSLAAMLLAMKHNTIFGLHNYKCSNKEIDFSQTPFVLTNSNTLWKTKDGKPRIGAISTFGNSGANAFAVIGEYLKKDNVSVDEEHESNYEHEKNYIFVFSAKNEEQLREIARKHANYFSENIDVRLKDVAYTLQTGRTAQNVRLAILASNREELIRRLRKYESGRKVQAEQNVEDKIFTGNKEVNNKTIYNGLPHKYEKILLEQMLINQDYEAIAMLWVQGNEVNWNLLYPKPENKISLPGYLFLKEHFWIKSNETEAEKKQIKDYDAETSVNTGNIEDSIIEYLSDKLRIGKNRLNVNVPIFEYGVTSIILLKLKQYIKDILHVNITNKDLIGLSTIKAIVEFCSIKKGIVEEKDVHLDEKADLHVSKIAAYKDEMVVEYLDQYEEGRINLKQLISTVGGEDDEHNEFN